MSTSYFFRSLISLGLVICLPVWFLASTYVLPHLLQILYPHPDQVYLGATFQAVAIFAPTSLTVLFLMFFFISRLNPSLSRWLTKEMVQLSQLERKSTSKKGRKFASNLIRFIDSPRGLILYSPLIFCVSLILLVLSLNSYIRIDSNHIYYSRFFTLGETSYSWKDDVAYVEDTYTIEKKNVIPEYIIHLKNGDTFDVGSNYCTVDFAGLPWFMIENVEPVKKIVTQYHIPVHKNLPPLDNQ